MTSPDAPTARDGGSIALVGAGPGDPDLLTVRAEDLLAAADTVMADAAVVHLARRFATRSGLIEVAEEADVVACLADEAAAGRRVVRLYAGDTWMHPDHQAEASALADRGLAVVSVPGVVTALAVGAEAGVAVHHRPVSVTATFTWGESTDRPISTDPTRTFVNTAADGAVSITRGGCELLHAEPLVAGPTGGRRG